MAPLSDFEKQRQENIQRNKELLRKLNLDSISDSIKRESTPTQPAKKRRTVTAKTSKKEPAAPTRRSSRLSGVKMENTEEYTKMKEEQEKAERKKKELEKLKQTRLYGDFNLIDLVTDKKLGSLKFENKVIKTEDDRENGEKQDDTENSTVKKEEQEPLEDVNIESDNRVLEILRNLGDKFSAGDFFSIIRLKSTEYSDKELNKKREEFDKLKIYEKFDPLDIKITHNRITSINFHPTVTDRIISAGDTSGNLGIWAVDSIESEDDPAITILKPHGKSISRILTSNAEPNKMLSGSYDGSIRQLDLNKLVSSEVLYLSDPFESKDYPLGISDINFPQDNNKNVLYLTTLSGNFYRHDLREKFKKPDNKSLLRLHDKKIGSFSINPNLSYQIATASLDRTLRIWDLRNISKSSWSEYEDQLSPHAYGSYSSRLSVSSVDWNYENRLVCNGYDDTINIFNLNGDDKSYSSITKWSQTYQPKNETSKVKDEEDEKIPSNIIPFTKIKHNCQTGRWVSILKSKWQYAPEDRMQKFVIANMNRGLDIYDQKGQILAHLKDLDKVGAVPAVATIHPTKNWAVGGSASGKLYFFE